MRVLVTGAAGSIGRVVSPCLQQHGHEVIGLDRVPVADGFEGRWLTVDCADPVEVDRAVADVRPDAIVHLASIPDERSLPTVLTSHVQTTAALLDAMVAHGVPRLVHASSNHAVGWTPRPAEGVLDVETRPRPDTFYGVGKVAAEALLSLYADRHGLDVVACRIGSFLERPQTARHLSTWLSHEDAVRMIEAALTAPSPGFAVLWGISANTRGWWDLAPGRALGYEPHSDAEEYADQVAPRPEDEAEGARVGGPFTLPEFERPAFGD